MNNILVVCEGNICRSPMAEGLLAAALPGARVRSAGLNALIGFPADEMASRLMMERGVDITSHRAVQVNREMCLRADLVLVMSSQQRQQLEQSYPQACGRIFRLGEYTKRDVPDPYRQLEEVFRESLRLIDEGVQEWLRRIRKI